MHAYRVLACTNANSVKTTSCNVTHKDFRVVSVLPSFFICLPWNWYTVRNYSNDIRVIKLVHFGFFGIIFRI